MSLPLDYFVSAVRDELGVASEVFGGGFIERALNEGQNRYAPNVALAKIATFTWAAGALSVALPSDLCQFDRLIPDAGTCLVDEPEVHGTSLVFECAARRSFNGRILYSAYYPEITDTAPCVLPRVAADGLVSYALYRCCKRLATNRLDYRRFSNLVAQPGTIAEFSAMADSHLADYQDAADAAYIPPSA